MINAIIGATGDIGKGLLVPMLSELGETIEVNRKSDQATWQRVWQADVIWLSIPREEIPKVLQGVQLHPDQLIVDVCSLKRHLSEEIRKTDAAFLSLHPLNGPRVELSGQKWVVVPTYSDQRHPHIQTILSFLQSKQISLLHADSEDHHDYMMAIVLSMPELLTIVVDTLIDVYAHNNNQQRPTMAQVMKWAVPASNALYSAHIHSINSSQDWLREDLISGAYGDLRNNAARAFQKLSTLHDDDVSNIIAQQRSFVETIPQQERNRIRQWVERWYVDSTQKIFSFNEKKSFKPKLNIQITKSATEVFPIDRKIKIGIHGIEGCFTEESALRLAEELQVDISQCELVYLVESARVIEAVVHGEVDRGVFAFANSGSGAYVSSVEAMSNNTFDVLAIYGMEILQCLIAHPNIHSIKDIQEVFGHPQAVSQCKRTFADKYPSIILREGKDSDDTALCVKMIADGKVPQTTATVASQIAAERYGMNILEYGMHHDPFNTTTFVVIKKK